MLQIGTLFLVAIVGLTSAHSRDKLPVFEYEYYVKYDLASQKPVWRCHGCENMNNNDDDNNNSETLCVNGLQRSLLGPEFDSSCESDDDVLNEPIAKALFPAFENHVDLICRVRKDNDLSRESVLVSTAKFSGKNEITLGINRSVLPVNPNADDTTTTQNPDDTTTLNPNEETTTKQQSENDDTSTTQDPDETTTTTENPDVSSNYDYIDDDAILVGDSDDDESTTESDKPSKNIFEKVADAVEDAVDDVVDVVDDVAGEVVDDVADVAGDVVDGIADAAGEIADVAEDVLPVVVDVAEEVGPAIAIL